jgi:hypothetical protein
MRDPTWIVVFGFTSLFSVVSERSVLGQSWLKDNTSCFCLKHKTTDQVLRNCTGAKLSGDYYVTATCQGSEQGDPKAIVEVHPPWMPIRNGAPGCTPCQPKPRRTDELPRRP